MLGKKNMDPIPKKLTWNAKALATSDFTLVAWQWMGLRFMFVLESFVAMNSLETAK